MLLVCKTRGKLSFDLMLIIGRGTVYLLKAPIEICAQSLRQIEARVACHLQQSLPKRKATCIGREDLYNSDNRMK